MENNKKIVPFLIIVAVLVGGYFLLFSNDSPQEEQQNEKQEKISESDILANELAQKYNAVTNWQENLTYTLEAQERIATGKPILFRGYVDDIFSRSGQTFVRFSSSFLSPTDFVLELECNRSVVDKILTQQTEDDFLKFFDEYAVVANIQDVSKPAFALEGSALSEDDVEIDIESSGLFTARGTCVDVVYIGDNDLFGE